METESEKVDLLALDVPAIAPARQSGGAGGMVEGLPRGTLWWVTLDGDLDCLELYERHYSKNLKRAAWRERKLFVGPGDKLVLRTAAADAAFVWRCFKDDSGQTGVNCAVFRNESAHLSSLLIRQADAIADEVWTDRRHYTYISSEKVASANPGYCFLMAGWRRCGMTKGGLIVMERTLPEPTPAASGNDPERSVE